MVACPARAELRRYLIHDGSLGPEQMRADRGARRDVLVVPGASWTV